MTSWPREQCFGWFFSKPLALSLTEGIRTPETTFPFKVLRFVIQYGLQNGAGGGSRTHTGIRPTDFKSGMSTIPSRPQLADWCRTIAVWGGIVKHPRALFSEKIAAHAGAQACGHFGADVCGV